MRKILSDRSAFVVALLFLALWIIASNAPASASPNRSPLNQTVPTRAATSAPPPQPPEPQNPPAPAETQPSEEPQDTTQTEATLAPSDTPTSVEAVPPEPSQTPEVIAASPTPSPVALGATATSTVSPSSTAQPSATIGFPPLPLVTPTQPIAEQAPTEETNLVLPGAMFVGGVLLVAILLITQRAKPSS